MGIINEIKMNIWNARLITTHKGGNGWDEYFGILLTRAEPA